MYELERSNLWSSRQKPTKIPNTCLFVIYIHGAYRTLCRAYKHWPSSVWYLNGVHLSSKYISGKQFFCSVCRSLGLYPGHSGLSSYLIDSAQNENDIIKGLKTQKQRELRIDYNTCNPLKQAIYHWYLVKACLTLLTSKCFS